MNEALVTIGKEIGKRVFYSTLIGFGVIESVDATKKYFETKNDAEEEDE